MKRLLRSVSLSFVALPLALVLAGCSANFGTMSPNTSQIALGTIKGMVHGGQQPIIGADIYLFAVGTGTYGGSSVSLLKNTGNVDNFGNSYVVTSSTGEFSISGDYTCTYSPTAPQVLYLYSINGDSGAGNNTAAGLMAVLGTCPPSGTLAGQLPYVYINEVSTVAAAYSLAGYATDATDIGIGGAGGNASDAPTVLASQGLNNAAANANQLFQVDGAGSPTQAANTTTPGSTKNNVGTVPAALINSIANSLAACVNSVPTSGTCSTLFSYLPVGPGRTKPADTATAAIYIAKNPGENVAEIYAVGGSNPAFTPALSSPPYDFTVAITYTAPSMVTPLDIAIDAVGNAWISSPAANSLTELSSVGVAKESFTETNPNYLDIDTTGNGASSVGPGNVFTVSDYSWTSGSGDKVKCNDSGSTGTSDCIYEITNTGVEDVPSHLTGAAYLLENTAEVVSDGTYNYFANLGNATIDVTNLASPAGEESDNNAMYNTPSTGAGTFLYLAVSAPSGYLWGTAPSTGYIARTIADESNKGDTVPIAKPGKIAIDSSSNAWVPDTTANILYRVLSSSPTKITLSPTGGYTGGGLDAPFGVAIDGSGTVWETNTGSISFGTGSTTCTGCSISAFYGNGSGAITPGSVGTSGTSYYNPNGGYTSGNLSGTVGYGNLAIDGSGDMWIVNSGESSVTEIIGVATPTVTPLAYAVANGYLGTTP